MLNDEDLKGRMIESQAEARRRQPLCIIGGLTFWAGPALAFITLDGRSAWVVAGAALVLGFSALWYWRLAESALDDLQQELVERFKRLGPDWS